jgi:RimJ/RimL family protein N-acetyltransferase
MITRLAKKDDAEQIARNNVKLAKISEDINIEYNQVLNGVKQVITDKNKGFYFVAEEKKEIIGQIMVTFEWSDWRNENIWWLQSIYVKEHWRKKGILKKLIKTIKTLGLTKNVHTFRLYVHKNNKGAISAYEKIGMKKEPYDIYTQTQ